jgi:hypothetical protein
VGARSKMQSLGGQRRRLENNIKTDPREIVVKM